MDDVLKTLSQGGIVLYPTDTVYGLAVDATNADAIEHLKQLKGRDEKKPISITVSDMEMAQHYAVLTPLAQVLAQTFLPGALTIVLEARNTLPSTLIAGTGTVGVRIPAHKGALSLVRAFGKPITATSANVANMGAQESPEKILAQFGERAKMIATVIDEGSHSAVASSVVDARGAVPIVLREGAVPTGEILRVVQS
jgi:L-threonylcarbamoyladenylate synthase